jgi:hypothetical protein
MARETLQKLPDLLVRANFDVSVATANLIADATELPPKGTVRLGDLSPELRQYQAQVGLDFLHDARDVDGQPISFDYARFNVEVYDKFLRDAVLFKALSYQTLGTVRAMADLSGEILGEVAEPSPAFHHLVARALEAGPQHPARERLERLSKLACTLGRLLPNYAHDAEAIATQGRALVGNASALLGSVMVVTHLPKAVASLSTSVDAVLLAGRWSFEAAPALRGFGRPRDGHRHPVDVQEGRLTRTELKEALFNP